MAYFLHIVTGNGMNCSKVHFDVVEIFIWYQLRTDSLQKMFTKYVRLCKNEALTVFRGMGDYCENRLLCFTSESKM